MCLNRFLAVHLPRVERTLNLAKNPAWPAITVRKRASPFGLLTGQSPATISMLLFPSRPSFRQTFPVGNTRRQMATFLLTQARPLRLPYSTAPQIRRLGEL